MASRCCAAHHGNGAMCGRNGVQCPTCHKPFCSLPCVQHHRLYTNNDCLNPRQQQRHGKRSWMSMNLGRLSGQDGAEEAVLSEGLPPGAAVVDEGITEDVVAVRGLHATKFQRYSRTCACVSAHTIHVSQGTFPEAETPLAM